jgi:hypothetical protein
VRSSDKGKPGEILGRKVIGPKVLRDYGSQTAEEPRIISWACFWDVNAKGMPVLASLFLLKPNAGKDDSKDENDQSQST